jgi:hypothetical protein
MARKKKPNDKRMIITFGVAAALVAAALIFVS